MQVSLENTASLERRMTVSLPAERLDGVVGKRLQEIAPHRRLKGFRPGKIPTKVIEQRFGAQVREEALGELVRTSFDEAVRQEKLQPAGNPGHPAAEPEGEDGEIRYTATFEVVPEFGEIDVDRARVRARHRHGRGFRHRRDARDAAPAAPGLASGRARRRRWATWSASRPIAVSRRRAASRPKAGSRAPRVLGSNAMLPELEVAAGRHASRRRARARSRVPGRLARARTGRPDGQGHGQDRPGRRVLRCPRSTKPSSRASACAAASWTCSARKCAPTSSASSRAR